MRRHSIRALVVCVTMCCAFFVFDACACKKCNCYFGNYLPYHIFIEKYLNDGTFGLDKKTVNSVKLDDFLAWSNFAGALKSLETIMGQKLYKKTGTSDFFLDLARRYGVYSLIKNKNVGLCRNVDAYLFLRRFFNVFACYSGYREGELILFPDYEEHSCRVGKFIKKRQDGKYQVEIDPPEAVQRKFGSLKEIVKDIAPLPCLWNVALKVIREKEASKRTTPCRR